MSTRHDLLFSDNDLGAVLRSNLDRARQDVDGIPESKFLASTDQEATEHVCSMREVQALELHEGEMRMEPQETKVDVRYDSYRAIHDRSRPFLIPGTRVTVSVPFSGDATLWRCQPSSYTLNPPRGVIRSSGDNDRGVLEISVERPVDQVGDGQDIKREVDETLSSIRSYLGWSKANVEAHNQELRRRIATFVQNRRAHLGTHDQLAKVLNIPLKKQHGVPDLAVRPLKRKLIKPLPTLHASNPEPGIRDEDYEHILNVIRHEGRTFEATPKTFAKHDEEELRDIILAHLNGHYEGDASGETFRVAGKTDIRIQFDNRAAFVAECKVWRGQKEIDEAIDQLAGYLTWRDSKAALIIFNKTVAGFTNVQSSIPTILGKHSSFLSMSKIAQPGEWRVRLRASGDDARRVLLHVFLLNLYVAPSAKR